MSEAQLCSASLGSVCCVGRGLGVTGRGKRAHRANGSCGLDMRGRAHAATWRPPVAGCMGGELGPGHWQRPPSLAPRPEATHLGLSLCVRASRVAGPPQEPRVCLCTGPLRGRLGSCHPASPPRVGVPAGCHGRMGVLRFPARVPEAGGPGRLALSEGPPHSWGHLRSRARC